jgi:hypothetical protein
LPLLRSGSQPAQRPPGHPAQMSKSSLLEVRTLTLSIEMIVDALLELDHAQGGTLYSGKVQEARMELGDDPGLTLIVAMNPLVQTEAATKRYTLTALAAAAIYYCFKSRIPLPRKSTKSMTIVPEGFQLMLQTHTEVADLNGSAMENWRTTREAPAEVPPAAAAAEPVAEEAMPEASAA